MRILGAHSSVNMISLNNIITIIISVASKPQPSDGWWSSQCCAELCRNEPRKHGLISSGHAAIAMHRMHDALEASHDNPDTHTHTDRLRPTRTDTGFNEARIWTVII